MKPCERFTVLEPRTSATPSRCDVCDHTEGAHENPGRRTLSGGEIEEIRRRMLMENFDRPQDDGRAG